MQADILLGPFGENANHEHHPSVGRARIAQGL